jgi:hypothetical protein
MNRLTMNRWVLGGGVIVTSALTLYSWNSILVQSNDSKEGKKNVDFASLGFLKSLRYGGEEKADRKPIPILSNVIEMLTLERQWSNQNSDRLPVSMENMYRDLLSQAQTVAESDRLDEAVMMVSGVPKNSRHFEMAQQLQNDWSQELLQRATKLYQQADIAGALSILNRIPPTCQQGHRAAELGDRWQEQAKWFRQAITARDQGNWNAAIAAVNALEGTPLYHSVDVQDILQASISNLLKPDEHLMQIASADLPATALLPSVPVNPPLSSVSALPMEPLPSATLPVDINRALEWSQPPIATPLPIEQPIGFQASPPFNSGFPNNKPLPLPNTLSSSPKPNPQANAF